MDSINSMYSNKISIIYFITIVIVIFTTLNTYTIMIQYEVTMNDGEYVGTKPTKEEALELRNETQRDYISRWCNVYEICTSKVTNLYSRKKIC